MRWSLLLILVTALPSFATTVNCNNNSGDFSLLQTALNGGGTVTVVGTCSTGSSPLQDNVAGTTLQGSGSNGNTSWHGSQTATVFNSTASYAIQTNANNITISGLTLNGAGIELTKNDRTTWTGQNGFTISRVSCHNITNGNDCIHVDNILGKGGNPNLIQASEGVNIWGYGGGYPNHPAYGTSCNSNNCIPGYFFYFDSGVDNITFDSNYCSEVGNRCIKGFWSGYMGNSFNFTGQNFTVSNNEMLKMFGYGMEYQGNVGGCPGGCKVGSNYLTFYTAKGNFFHDPEPGTYDDYGVSWPGIYGANGMLEINNTMAFNQTNVTIRPGIGFEMGVGNGTNNFQGNIASSLAPNPGWADYILQDFAQFGTTSVTYYNNVFCGAGAASQGPPVATGQGAATNPTQLYNIWSNTCPSGTSIAASNLAMAFTSPNNQNFGSSTSGTFSLYVTNNISNANVTFAVDGVTAPVLSGSNPQELSDVNTNFPNDQRYLYHATINPQNYSAGSHTVTATATDVSHTTLSVSQNFTVAGVSGPNVTLAPTSLSFGGWTLGTTSSAMTSSLTNTGTSALTITSLSLTGSNVGDFILSHNCPVSPSTLAAGSNCTISVMFQPQVVGSRSANVQVVDNATSGATQLLPLSGVGLASPTSAGLIANSTFIGVSGSSSGDSVTSGNWTVQTVSPAAVNFSNDASGPNGANEAVITGTHTGPNAQYFLSQDTLGQLVSPVKQFTSGTQYDLVFQAKSTVAGVQLAPSIFKNSNSVVNYGLNGVAYTLGTTFQTFVAAFTTSGFTGAVTDAKLQFSINGFGSGPSVSISNVALIPVGAGLIANSTFLGVSGTSSGGTTTVGDWQVQTTSPCAISFTNDGSGPNGANEIVLTMTSTGTGMACSLNQDTLGQLLTPAVSFQPNTQYKLSFQAQASGSGITAGASVVKDSNTAQNYGLNNVAFNLTTTYSSYSATFVSSGFANPVNDALLMLSFSGTGLQTGSTIKLTGASLNPITVQVPLVTITGIDGVSHSDARINYTFASATPVVSSVVKYAVAPALCNATGASTQPATTASLFSPWSIVLAGLAPSTSYNICISLANSSGVSADTSQATITTLPLPAVHPALPIAPTNLSSDYPNTAGYTTVTTLSNCSDLQSKITTAITNQGSNGTIIQIPAGANCVGLNNILFNTLAPDAHSWHAADVNTTNSTITWTGHGLSEQQLVTVGRSYAATNSYPTVTNCAYGTGFTDGGKYYVHVVDANTIRLYCSDQSTLMTFQDTGVTPGALYLVPHVSTTGSCPTPYGAVTCTYWKRNLNWIIIRSSSTDSVLPPEHSRVSPAWTSKMAMLTNPVTNVASSLAANFFLNFGDTDANNQYMLGNIRIGPGLEFTNANDASDRVYAYLTYVPQWASDIVFDRVWWHGGGTPQRWGGPSLPAMAFNGMNVVVKDSYIDNLTDWHSTAQDGSSIILSAGPGPTQVFDTYLEGAGILLHFDGAGCVLCGDNTVIRNTFELPLKYMFGNVASDGNLYGNRQPLEFKAGIRDYVAGNIFDHSWVEQTGSSVFLAATSVAGTGITDMNVESNSFMHGPGVSNIPEIVPGGAPQSPPPNRFSFTNNLAYDISSAWYVSQGGANTPTGWVFQGPQGSEDATVNHNTMIGNAGRQPSLLFMQDTKVEGINVANNILFVAAGQGINIDGAITHPCSSNTDVSLWNCNTLNSTWSNNLLVGNGSTKTQLQTAFSGLSSYYLNDPQIYSSVGFFSLVLNNYRLRSNYCSGCGNPASDGTDVGADMDMLARAEGQMGSVSIPENGITTNSAVVSFVAPDSQGCPVDYSQSDPNVMSSFTRVADAGGSRVRNITLTSLLGKTIYYYRINCAVQQPMGTFRTH